MSGKNSVVSMTLQLNGKQAQQVLQQFLQTQKTSTAEILKTNRNLEGVLRQQAQQTSIQAKQYQQMSKLVQQQRTTLAQSTVQTQATLRTNQLLERVLQQQVRQSTLLTQNNRNQNRDYQLQLNILRQQVAAAERLRQQLEQAGRANREMNHGGVGGGSAMQNTAAAVGATYAIGSIGANYLKDPRETKRQISLITGTLYGGEKMSQEQRQQKNNETESWIKDAAVKGGSSIPDVLRALNAFAADPAFDKSELKTVLLEASSTAFASGSDAEAVAKSMIATRRFGISDYKTANDMMFRGGQLGSFEIPDMAQNLPEILSKAKGQYSNDLEGYRKIISNLQISKYTAATSSQAATNYSNYLGDLDQHHLSLQVAKFITPSEEDILSKYGVAGKRTGVDFAKGAAKAKLEKGMDQDEYLAYLINREMMKDPLYKQYKHEAKALKNKIKENQRLGISSSDEELAWATRMEGAERIIGNSKFGKILHNAQSGAYYRAKAAYAEEYDFISSELDTDKVRGVKDEEFKHQSNEEYAKDGSFQTAKDIAKLNNYNSVSGWLGDLKQTLADFASSNEGVAAAASAAVLGLTAVGVAGGVAALTMRTRGGAGGVAAGAAGGTVMGAARAAGQVGLAGVLGYGIGTAARNMYMTTETGRNFDENLGEVVAKVWQYMPDWMGGDAAKSAVEAQAKYDEMIKQQQEANEHSRETNKNFNTLISVVKDSQGMVPNFSQLFAHPSLNQQPQSIVGDRQGAVPFMLQKH